VSRVRIEEKFAVVPEWLLSADISAQAVRIYAVMARYADRTGKAFPSHRAISERVRCSIRTVQRGLDELVTLGAVEVRERKDAAGQRSNEYFIRVSRPLAIGDQGGLFTHDQGPLDTDGRQNESHSEREEPTPLSATQTSPHDPFEDDFWPKWPDQRRQGKGAARVAFRKAVAKVGVEAVLAGVDRLRDDPNLPVEEPTLIPLPATWLNQERWDDGPLPARRGPPRFESAATQGLRKIAARREARNGDGPGESGRAGLPAGPGLSRPAD